MLQWMGGSRRKVTTSRMSTQKRQKQYFEQRKRQQQEQNRIGEDNYYEKPSTSNPHQNNNRSLDILSLMNLPRSAQEDNSICPNSNLPRINSKGKHWRNGMPCSYQNTPCSPTVQINKVSQVDPIDRDTIKVTNPSYQEENVCQMKSSFSYADIHNKPSNGDGGNLDQLKFSSNHQLSVLDLLGDVGPNSNYEGNSSREAHVAFSIEGLGKVETETPVHSPQPTGRTISYNCSSPTKITKRAHFSKSLKCRMDDLVPKRDDMMQDIDMRFCGNSSELPFYSSDIMDSYSKPKHNLSAVEEFMQYDDINFISKNAFGDKEVYCNYQDKAQHSWDDSQFLDMKFHDEVEYGSSWKNWHWKADLNNPDCLDIRNQEKADFYFEGPCTRNKSTFPTSNGKFNILDSPVQYSNQRIPENDFDFITPHDAWHTTLQRNDIGDIMNSSPWPSSKKEEEMDSWSLPSEESCSSSAVRDQAAEKEPFNSTQMHRSRKHSTTQRTTTCKNDLNTNIKQTNYFPRENINGPPIPSTSKKKLDLDSDCLFEERYGTRTINSFSDHFKDPFDDDAKLFSKSSKCSITAEFPLYSNYFLDNHLHSSEGPPFPNIRSKSRIDHQEWEPYQDMKFSDILVHRTVSKDGGMKHSAISPPVSENLEFSVDDCNVSNVLSVKNGTQGDAMDSEDSCSHLKEVNRTPKTKESIKTPCCSEHEEESLLSAEIADKSKAIVDGEEGQNGSQNSSPCQPVLKEVEESEAKEHIVEDKVTRSESGDTTCQT